jgi:predicted glycosyltransferase
MRAICHAQHLSGVGHFVRMHAIACALAAAGHDVHLVDGGRPVPRADAERLQRLELPGLQRIDGRLVGMDGSAGAGVVAERARRLAEAVERIRPDVVVVDHFPFSKWELEPELAGAARAGRRVGARMVCSLRDVVRQTAFEDVPPRAYASRVLALLREHFDAVLIHADPSVVRLEKHFDQASDLTLPVRYTGFVGLAPRPSADTDPDTSARPYAVLSCGGTDGRRFLRAAVEGFRRAVADGRVGRMALRMFPDPRTAADVGELGLATDPSIRVVGFTSGFGSALAGSALSISRAGYNTSVEVLMTGVPAVVAPDATMSDQGARAQRLASLGLVALVEGDPPHPDDVAAAIARAIALPRPRARVDLDGAATTRALLERLVAEGEDAWRSTDSSASRSTPV